MQQQKVRTAQPTAVQSRERDYTLENWCNLAVVMLGCWLIVTAVSSNYQSNPLFVSDLITGASFVLLGLLSNTIAALRWMTAIGGAWLLFAPLVFWAPTSVSYTTDTLIGSLAVAFAFVIPGIPGIKTNLEGGHEKPPGWSYNPSSWPQRVPLIALALIGFSLARYMAAYQLGHVDSSWDPFFGDSTERVLKSEVSRAFPVSDAGLGAMSYLVDALAGAIGGIRRWRTMPWMVVLFGALVIPPGVVSIVLVILQPVAVGAWCSLCLLASIVMLIMVPLAVDEVIATCQYLGRVRERGLPFWTIFFRGGPELEDRELVPAARKTDAMRVPMHLAAGAALGAWLMVSPAFFPVDSLALTSLYVTAALIVTFSFIAFAEVCRSVRLLNIILGAWLILAPFVLSNFSAAAVLNSVASGALLAIISVPRGRIREQYGSWNRRIL